MSTLNKLPFISPGRDFCVMVSRSKACFQKWPAKSIKDTRLLVKKITLSSVLPRWFVPVVLTESSVTEWVVLPASRRRRRAALLLGTTPLMGVQGDTSCLVAVCTCRTSGGTRLSAHLHLTRF